LKRGEEGSTIRKEQLPSLIVSIMFFHIAVFFATLLFFGFLEAFIALPARFSPIAAFFLTVLFRMSWRFGGSIGSALIPTLFSLSAYILLFFVSAPKEKHTFIFLSSMVFYVAMLGNYRLKQYKGDVTAQSMLSLVAITALFFLFSAFYGVFLNFQRFDEATLMISYGISAFLIGFSAFARLFRNETRKAWLSSLLLGIFAAQIGWIGSFWPFGYLTSGVLALMMISPLWDTIQSEALGTFSKKRLVVHTLLILSLVGMVLVSSPWLPVV
jgi:hypothetical protein